MTAAPSNVYTEFDPLPLPLDDSEVRLIIGQTPSRLHSASLREAARNWLENMHRANHPALRRFMDRADNRERHPNRIIGFAGSEGDGSRLASLQHCLQAYAGGQILLSPWGTLSGWRCTTRTLFELNQEHWRGAVIWLDLDVMAPTTDSLADLEEIVRTLLWRPPDPGDPLTGDADARRRNGVEVVLNLGNTVAWTPLYHLCDEVWYIERHDPAGLLRETELASFLRNPFAVNDGRVSEDPGDHVYLNRRVRRSSWTPDQDPWPERDTEAPARTDGIVPDDIGRGDAPTDTDQSDPGLAEPLLDVFAELENFDDKPHAIRPGFGRLKRDWVILASMLLCGDK